MEKKQTQREELARLVTEIGVLKEGTTNAKELLGVVLDESYKKEEKKS